MNDRFDKLEEKIDKLDEKVDAINNTLTRNTSSLEKHEYRTTLAERRMDAIDKELAPLKDHMTFVMNVVKITAIVGSILMFAKQLELF